MPLREVYLHYSMNNRSFLVYILQCMKDFRVYADIRKSLIHCNIHKYANKSKQLLSIINDKVTVCQRIDDLLILVLFGFHSFKITLTKSFYVFPFGLWTYLTRYGYLHTKHTGNGVISETKHLLWGYSLVALTISLVLPLTRTKLFKRCQITTVPWPYTFN